MNRRTIAVILLFAAVASCCPWADWAPCRAMVTVSDANGQPLDATVIILEGISREEFSRTDCPGHCIVEVSDLFHNGEWSSSDGLVIRVEAAGKQAQEKEFVCYWEGMMGADAGLVREAVAFELPDSP
jgi:hypothetical protein